MRVIYSYYVRVGADAGSERTAARRASAAAPAAASGTPPRQRRRRARRDRRLPMAILRTSTIKIFIKNGTDQRSENLLNLI